MKDFSEIEVALVLGENGARLDVMSLDMLSSSEEYFVRSQLVFDRKLSVIMNIITSHPTEGFLIGSPLMNAAARCVKEIKIDGTATAKEKKHEMGKTESCVYKWHRQNENNNWKRC